jgi:hypothetical protein
MMRRSRSAFDTNCTPRGNRPLLRLLIMTFDPPQNIGGVEGRVQGYVTELTRRGDFVEVEAFAPGYRFTDEAFYG